MSRHEVELGDELLVCGQLFILTEVRMELDKPSVLTTKQPIELVRVPVDDF